ncbi:MAG: D-alanyl-D-alanine dipeptidase [Ignavibacteriae bacterium]|nr:D-alanyl-D-alanine dipeptidase [Ignavibacteriota bacterium]
MKTQVVLILLLVIFLPSLLYCQPDTALVRLRDIDPSIRIDVRYATTNNFTGKILYPGAELYLRKEVAERLSEVQAFIMMLGFRLKVYDGYRPLSIQKILWDATKEKKYVVNPANGSKHNRGAAVDVTLVDAKGKELDMGSEFDSFSEMSNSDAKGLSENVKKNRDILTSAMQMFGFVPNSREWWHFDYEGWKKYSVLDWKWW